jgi:putative ABC transport system ATP-binding protein
MDLLERLTRRAGRTLLLATHSAAVAARADRVLVIEEGHLVASRAEAVSP